MKVSCHALSTLHTNKRDKHTLLPCATDLVKLRRYQLERISTLTEVIHSVSSVALCRELADVTLSSVIVFNKRRGGEAAKLMISDFLDRPKWHDTAQDEFTALLSPLEQKLCNTLELIQIQGKRKHTVPMLLHDSDKKAVEMLIKHGDILDVNSQNVFCYPSRQSVSCLRGHDCLRRVAEKAGLENPDLIRSTKLR